VNTTLPENTFRRAMRDRRVQIGLWANLCSSLAVEITSGSGFDWLLVDTEHAPNELPDVVRQLQAMGDSPSAAVIRPAWNDPVLFKRYLDAGARNFMVPFIQTPAEAQAAVAATRYPPAGIRGVASTTRANQFGRCRDYFQKANQEIGIMVQIETRLALDNIEAIAAVEGVDCLFIGPSDLASSLGHIGNNAHPEVRAALDDAIQRIGRTGKASGILAPVEADARHWLTRGATVVAVGSDGGLLARQSEQLAARFKEQPHG
jgi:4-hydroxy-2-oxoheptanedioate aldolase